MTDMYSIYESSYKDAKELVEGGATENGLIDLLAVYEYCPVTLLAISDVLESEGIL